MAERLTTEKKKKIFDLCHEVLLKESVSIRLISKLLGKFTSNFQAIKYGQLHYPVLERLKTKALKINKGNFDKKTSIVSHGRQDIIWWKNNILGSFSTIRIENPSFTVTTDASRTGWGAVFKNISRGGKFSITETLMHINVLELKAILFELRSLCVHISNSYIKILSDNTTAVHCICYVGSCRYVDCDKITKSIWGWAHIPGGLNREADEKSRVKKTELRIEWQLNRTIFHNMVEYFQYYLEVDLFASRLNAQLLRFFSYKPNPFGEVTNAFSVSWENDKFYCFPPFACRDKILQKITADKATVLLMMPNWPTQIWFPS